MAEQSQSTPSSSPNAQGKRPAQIVKDQLDPMHPANRPIPENDRGDEYGDGFGDIPMGRPEKTFYTGSVWVVCQQEPLKDLTLSGGVTINTMMNDFPYILCACSSKMFAERELKIRTEQWEAAVLHRQAFKAARSSTEAVYYKSGAAGLANFMARLYIGGLHQLIKYQCCGWSWRGGSRGIGGCVE